MNDESAPKGASETPAKKSGPIVPPRNDTLPIFDVVSANGGTRYAPAEEMARALAGDNWWRSLARQDVIAWLETHETVSSDEPELRDLIPEPVNPNAWGALFSAMAKAGELEFVAYRRSRRRPAHSRVVSVWRRAR